MKKYIILLLTFLVFIWLVWKTQEVIIWCRDTWCYDEAIINDVKNIENISIQSVLIRWDFNSNNETIDIWIDWNYYNWIDINKTTNQFIEWLTTKYINWEKESFIISWEASNWVNQTPSWMSNVWEAKFIISYDLVENLNWSWTIINLNWWWVMENAQNIGNESVKIMWIQDWEIFLYKDQIIKLIIDLLLASFFLFLIWKMIRLVIFLIYG